MDGVGPSYGALPQGTRGNAEKMLVPQSKLEELQTALAMVGLGKPLARFTCATLLTATLLLAIRPKYCFRANGQMRPFKNRYTPEQVEDSTYYHFFLVPLVTGVVFSQCL